MEEHFREESLATETAAVMAVACCSRCVVVHDPRFLRPVVVRHFYLVWAILADQDEKIAGTARLGGFFEAEEGSRSLSFAGVELLGDRRHYWRKILLSLFQHCLDLLVRRSLPLLLDDHHAFHHVHDHALSIRNPLAVVEAVDAKLLVHKSHGSTGSVSRNTCTEKTDVVTVPLKFGGDHLPPPDGNRGGGPFVLPKAGGPGPGPGK